MNRDKWNYTDVFSLTLQIPNLSATLFCALSITEQFLVLALALVVIWERVGSVVMEGVINGRSWGDCIVDVVKPELVDDGVCKEEGAGCCGSVCGDLVEKSCSDETKTGAGGELGE